MKRKITLILVLLLVFFIKNALCQEWIVPQDQIDIKNPSVYNRQNVKDGKAIFGFYTTKTYPDATVTLKEGRKVLLEEKIL